MNLIKPKEISDRFHIPYLTAYRWSKDIKSWRKQLYTELEKVYIKELSQKAKEL